MTVKKVSDGRVYQLNITLKGIRPPIWRRMQVPGAIRLAALHQVIQTVFGWTDSHLHQFVVAGETYGRQDDFDEAVEDESGVTLAKALGTRTKRFLYVYDFGDNWEHDVVVENIVAGNSGSEGPLCLGGKRHRPPEDCAGPRRDIKISLRQSAIRGTRSMKLCSNGSEAVLMRRRLILRR